MPEWLVERGIGETRAALIEDGEIVEARIQLEGSVPAGSVLNATLLSTGINGRNAVAVADGGAEYLLPRGAPGVTEGAAITIAVTREAIPGSEPWKRAVGRLTQEVPFIASLLSDVSGRLVVFPSPHDELAAAGWDDLIEQARSGVVAFAGGELRLSPTPAMTLIDVDGYLPAAELAVLGAREAARAIRRLDIGGSIGIDLPTVSSKNIRRAAAHEFDAVVPQPFERTAVNGFGFVQVVRPRKRASLLELARDHSTFEARVLLRRVGRDTTGSKTIVAHPAIIRTLEERRPWLDALSRQLGGTISLRANAGLAMSGGYAEA